MTTQGAEAVIATVYRGNKKAGAFLLALFGVSFLYGTVIAIQAHEVVWGVVSAVPGLLLVAGAVVAIRTPGKVHELIFTAEGFRFRTPSGSWFVAWTEISGISVHRVNFTDGGQAHSLYFWPASIETTARQDLAYLRQDLDSGHRFRLSLFTGTQAVPEIERGVATFRRDLWRPDVPEQRRGRTGTTS